MPKAKDAPSATQLHGYAWRAIADQNVRGTAYNVADAAGIRFLTVPTRYKVHAQLLAAVVSSQVLPDGAPQSQLSPQAHLHAYAVRAAFEHWAPDAPSRGLPAVFRSWAAWCEAHRVYRHAQDQNWVKVDVAEPLHAEPIGGYARCTFCDDVQLPRIGDAVGPWYRIRASLQPSRWE